MNPTQIASGDDTTRLRRFFTGAGFPACLIAGAVVYEAFLLLVIFGPPGQGPWGQFSEDFKRWCFGYDGRTGGMSWGAVWVMLAEPLFLAGLTAALWRRALATLATRRGLAAHGKAMAAGALASLLATATLFAYGSRGTSGDPPLPFPGERIRTRIEPPPFDLVDHRGAPVSLADSRGRVVLITGVYATCSTACPQILREVKDLIESLPPELRERFSAVALSLNPEYDTREMMTAIAEAYGFPYPAFRYASGPPSDMHDLLTRLQFAAVKNPQTGAIDHANLFLLVDAGGRIAYRFNLLDRHRPWLHQATRQLLEEASDAALATTASARP
jgi:cytochrome oxidase Cu insertion factor (SCO1/SenC/PrrC family)